MVLKVSEIFYSIQGEGIQIGIPTIFIRLAGCNLRCKWCDTKWVFKAGKEMLIDKIMDEIKKYSTKYVCVTGGEPLLQKDVFELIKMLLDEDYSICIETNGSISIEELPCSERLLISMDIKCPSSGMQDRMNFSNIELLNTGDQLKFVIEDNRDYEYAKEIIAKYLPICSIVMTPVGGKNMNFIAEKVLEDGMHVRVLPQLHKLIWGDKKGV
jgi:7-carboxy-7-deazaguanine synthase